jgi:hypothetical protein
VTFMRLIKQVACPHKNQQRGSSWKRGERLGNDSLHVVCFRDDSKFECRVHIYDGIDVINLLERLQILALV